MARTKLPEGDVDKRIGGFPGWERDGSVLRKAWAFKDYAHATLFVNAVAHVADQHDHHPDVTFGYGYVKMALSTHDVGGITESDLAFVEAVEALPLKLYVEK